MELKRVKQKTEEEIDESKQKAEEEIDELKQKAEEKYNQINKLMQEAELLRKQLEATKYSNTTPCAFFSSHSK